MTGASPSMEPLCGLITIYITAVLYSSVLTATVLDEKTRKTPQAAEKANDLSCFVCDSMDAGERCSNLNTSGVSFIHKCHDDRRTCMVKRYSYSTTTENSTYPSKRLWSLQRNCTNKCEAGCIVIGERTKLYACTVCCGQSLCNTMNDGAPHHRHSSFVIVLCVLVLTAFTS